MGSSVKTNCKIHAIAIGKTLKVEAFNDLFVRSQFNQQQKMLMNFFTNNEFFEKKINSNIHQDYIQLS